MVLGMGFSVFSRVLVGAVLLLAACSTDETEQARPGVGDHWHVAYGIYICDSYAVDFAGSDFDTSGASISPLRGDLTGDDGFPPGKNYKIVGVHSHNDGLIHFHPFSDLAAGPKANLGLFLSMYGIGISDEQVDLPEYLGGSLIENDSTCMAYDAEVQVQYWPDASVPDVFTTFTTDLAKVPLIEDGAAVALMFARPGTLAPLPPSVGTPITDM